MLQSIATEHNTRANMSSSAAPIPPHRFAEAITALPLSNLHIKAAELRNSIAHLELSNHQLQSFAEGGDQDCMDAIRENQEVISRMVGRIDMLKAEVEGRGFRWAENEGKPDDSAVESGRLNGGNRAHLAGNGATAQQTENAVLRGGSLNDEELARRLSERLRETGDEDDSNGLHL